MRFLNKINPIAWLVKAMDATDTWVERMSYQGTHWATA